MQISSILEHITPEKPDTSASCGMHPLPHFADDFNNPLGEWWINKNFNLDSTKKGENLTFTPKDNRKESALDKADRAWRNRLDSNRAEVLTMIRDAMVNLSDLTRHTRSLVWNADDGLLLWEVSRKTPEGVTAGLCMNQRGLEILEQYGRTLEDLDRPVLMKRPESIENYLTAQVFASILEQYSEKGMIFDRIFFRDPFNCTDSINVLADALKKLPENLCPDELKLVISQRIPSKGQRIWELLYNQILTESTRSAWEVLLKKMELAENEFFLNQENPLFDWNEQTIDEAFREQRPQRTIRHAGGQDLLLRGTPFPLEEAAWRGKLTEGAISGGQMRPQNVFHSNFSVLE